jgi:cellobiose-specific phosphotransferase system component IIC
MAMHPDEAMFQYILQRSRTRETSILAVATIATSASLVLLGLLVQAEISVAGTKEPEDNNLLNRYRYWMQVVGILFASVGIAYRQVTARTIHRNDESWIETFIMRLRQDCRNTVGQQIINTRDTKIGKNIDEPICYCKKKPLREGLIISLLLIPLISWGIFALNLSISIPEVIPEIIIAGFSFGFSGFIVGWQICDSCKKD